MRGSSALIELGPNEQAQFECGLRCVEELAVRHGISTSLDRIRLLATVSERGINIDQMLNLMAAIGLLGRAINIEMDFLPFVKTPCIAHLKRGHFVVLTCISLSHVGVIDSMLGQRRLPLAWLSNNWSMNIVEVVSTAAMPDNTEGI